MLRREHDVRRIGLAFDLEQQTRFARFAAQVMDQFTIFQAKHGREPGWISLLRNSLKFERLRLAIVLQRDGDVLRFDRDILF
jgi:hypothetical protein